MSRTGKLKRFLLFTVMSNTGRKDFVGSYDSKTDAVGEGVKLKTFPQLTTSLQWQVYDNAVSEVVAEDRGADRPAV